MVQLDVDFGLLWVSLLDQEVVQEIQVRVLSLELLDLELFLLQLRQLVDLENIGRTHEFGPLSVDDLVGHLVELVVVLVQVVELLLVFVGLCRLVLVQFLQPCEALLA